MIAGEFQDLLNRDSIYKPTEIHEIMGEVRRHFRFAWTNRKHKYFDVPAAFDIETTSFIDKDGEKAATMYEWTFGIYGLVIVGRTWDEFTAMMNDLVNELKLTTNKRLIVYVHNLSFEFQFIRKRFKWSEVFSIKNRTPLFALTTTGIEFRCSYLLSGYSLDMVGRQLTRYKVRKMVGLLDYEKPRNAKTPLTDDELLYCVNDVKVVMAYIAERIKDDGAISKIPLTKTGYVRNYVRNACFYDGENKKSFKRMRYREMIKGLTLEVDEYDQLKRAFQGGYTHANGHYTGVEVEGVTSWDFTSSYPTVMIANLFPMSKAERVEVTTMEDFEKNLDLYCCVFDLELTGLRSKFDGDDYISLSRCWGTRGAVVNNGRIHSAEHLFTTVTEVDFFIIKSVYEWDEMKVADMRRYRRGYLPTDFVRSILDLYAVKTTLKGVEGREAEYLHGKENINSCFGMICTDICREEVTYIDDEWGVTPADKAAQIEKYNNGAGRFLFYPWGVYVTAYARANLWGGILECGTDYVYSDTDSIKILNAERHMEYIREYNDSIRSDLIKAMDFHGLPHEMVEPMTAKGEKKCLGVWDFDGHYSRFKTLGAKRYMVEYSNDPRNGGDAGKLSLTVSGLNKRKCVPYLKEKYGAAIFGAFTNRLHVPPGETGKLTHTYIDAERKGVLTDYEGHDAEYDELSAVHLAPAEYSLSMSSEYVNFLTNLEGGFIDG